MKARLVKNIVPDTCIATIATRTEDENPVTHSELRISDKGGNRPYSFQAWKVHADGTAEPDAERHYFRLNRDELTAMRDAINGILAE